MKTLKKKKPRDNAGPGNLPSPAAGVGGGNGGGGAQKTLPGEVRRRGLADTNNIQKKKRMDLGRF